MERVTVYLQAIPINLARQTFVDRCSVIISIIESTARERIVVGEEILATLGARATNTQICG